MQKYRLPLGIFMAFLIANAVLWKDLHQLFLHEHDTLHCEAEGSQTHIHGEEYLPTTCLICGFQFSSDEYIEQELVPVSISPTFSFAQFNQLSFAKDLIISSTSPRGPPFLRA